MAAAHELLRQACLAGDEHTVRGLLASGADPSACTGTRGTTLLHDLATRGGSESMVQLLVSAGAGVNRQNADGCTPLYEACHWGHADVVAGLLHAGAAVNLTCVADGSTAIVAACREGHTHLLPLLLSAGAAAFGSPSAWAIVLGRGDHPSVRRIMTDCALDTIPPDVHIPPEVVVTRCDLWSWRRHVDLRLKLLSWRRSCAMQCALGR
jgi:ankyrin repeat protein